jgi:lipopolysaccharide export system permease protein
MRAAGLTKFKILKPFMLIAVLVSINIYFFNQQLIPNAHRNVRTKINIISSASLIQGIKSGQFFTAIPNMTLFPAKMDNENLELEDIYLNVYSPKIDEEKIIWAKEGQILHKKDEDSGLESFNLRLKDGNITSMRPGNTLEKIIFEEYELPISEKRFSYTPSTKEIMMGKDELNRFIAAGEKEAVDKGFSKKEYHKAKFEYWNRLNAPVQVLIFAFLGFGLGVVGNRGKKKNSSGKAIIFLISYYVIYFSLINIVRDFNLPIIISIIIPSTFILFFGVKYYRNLDWLS